MGKIVEEIVANFLREPARYDDIGLYVYELKHPSEFTEKTISIEAKRLYESEPYFKIDGIAGDGSRSFLYDAKSKKKPKWLCNVSDYDVYYEMSKSLPILIFFGLVDEEGVKSFHIHKVINPKDFKNYTARDKNKVYVIPDNLLVEWDGSTKVIEKVLGFKFFQGPCQSHTHKVN